MKTEREAARNLVSAISSISTPRACFTKLRKLLAGWRQPAIGDPKRIGAGTYAVLQRLCDAQVAYEQALDDARTILEVI